MVVVVVLLVWRCAMEIGAAIYSPPWPGCLAIRGQQYAHHNTDTDTHKNNNNNNNLNVRTHASEI
jgi:hypothetical protein